MSYKVRQKNTGPSGPVYDERKWSVLISPFPLDEAIARKAIGAGRYMVRPMIGTTIISPAEDDICHGAFSVEPYAA